MLDALTLEKRGIPSVCIGVEKLVKTTGQGMARAHGLSGYNFAIIAHDTGPLADLHSEGQIEAIVESLVPQIIQALTGPQPVLARPGTASAPPA